MRSPFRIVYLAVPHILLSFIRTWQGILSSNLYLPLSCFLGIVLSACNDSPSEPPVAREARIELEPHGAGVVETWIRVILDSMVQSRQVELKRDGKSIFKSELTVTDTVIIDESLQPSTPHAYQAYLLDDSIVVESSEAITMTTMDTTSHELSWRMDTLSEWGGLLYDVALIDENNIWVVGEIFLSDSTGAPDPSRYAIGRWDGTQWIFTRIYTNCRLYYPTCGGDTLVNSEAQAIFAFGPNDIWISAGSMHHFDGTTWKEYGDLPLYAVNRIWGSDPTNVYAVGLDGLVARFNGSWWTRLQSGTTLDVHDIYGALDSLTGEQTVLCVASEGTEKVLLQIDGVTVKPNSSDGLATDIDGIWFCPGKYYYVVGDGVHQKRGLNAPYWSVYPPGVVTTYHSAAISGSNINDVFVVGSFMEIVHFNGLSWANYRNVLPIASGPFAEIAVRGNLVVAVGFQGQDAVVLFGTR